MNKKEALKRFDERIKEREELIQQIKNDKIRLFKVITCTGDHYYFVSCSTLEEMEKNVMAIRAEIAEYRKGATRKMVANMDFKVELIKEA